MVVNNTKKMTSIVCPVFLHTAGVRVVLSIPLLRCFEHNDVHRSDTQVIYNMGTGPRLESSWRSESSIELASCLCKFLV
jgi:hypothetical protein